MIKLSVFLINPYKNCVRFKDSNNNKCLDSFFDRVIMLYEI